MGTYEIDDVDADDCSQHRECLERAQTLQALKITLTMLAAIISIIIVIIRPNDQQSLANHPGANSSNPVVFSHS